FGVGSAAVEAKSKIDKRIKELSDANPKCQKYLDNLDDEKKDLEKRRNEVWAEVYAAQAGLIHWPARLASLDGLYFGDRIGDEFRTVYRERDVYINEYTNLPEIVAPTIFLDRDLSKVLHFQAE